jgi:hypothetical protein
VGSSTVPQLSYPFSVSNVTSLVKTDNKKEETSREDESVKKELQQIEEQRDKELEERKKQKELERKKERETELENEEKKKK